MSEFSPAQKLSKIMSRVDDAGLFIPDLQYLGALDPEIVSFVPDRIAPVIVSSSNDDPRLIISGGFSKREISGYPAENFAPHTSLRYGEEGAWSSGYIIGGHNDEGVLSISYFGGLVGDKDTFEYAKNLHDRYGFTEMYTDTLAIYPEENNIQLPYRVSEVLRELMGWRYRSFMFEDYEDVLRCTKTSLDLMKKRRRGFSVDEVIRFAGVVPKV